MPTKDPVKNLEYVKKSQAKKKEAIGVEEFNRIHTEAQMKYKKNLRERDEEEFKRKNAEYMKGYMKQKRLRDKEGKRAEEVKRKTEATRQGQSMVEEALQKILDEIPQKRKRGRPPKVKKIGRAHV